MSSTYCPSNLIQIGKALGFEQCVIIGLFHTKEYLAFVTTKRYVTSIHNPDYPIKDSLVLIFKDSSEDFIFIYSIYLLLIFYLFFYSKFLHFSKKLILYIIIQI